MSLQKLFAQNQISGVQNTHFDLYNLFDLMVLKVKYNCFVKSISINSRLYQVLIFSKIDIAWVHFKYIQIRYFWGTINAFEYANLCKFFLKQNKRYQKIVKMMSCITYTRLYDKRTQSYTLLKYISCNILPLSQNKNLFDILIHICK